MLKLSVGLRLLPALFLAACGGTSTEVNHTNPASNMAGAPAQPVAIFSGPRANYLVTKNAQSTIVEDIVGSDGTRTVPNSSKLQFSNLTTDPSMAGVAAAIPEAGLNSIIELYIAFFNRVPDADGLRYWITQYKNGMSLDQMSNAFYEAAILYSSSTGYSKTMSNTSFVLRIYSNVLGRNGMNSPSTDEVNYWVKELQSGKPKSVLVATMLSSAHTFKGDAKWGWVTNILDNRVTIGKKFAVESGITFNTPEDAIEIGNDISIGVLPSGSDLANSIAAQYWGNSRTRSAARNEAEGFYASTAPTWGLPNKLLILDDGRFWNFAFDEMKVNDPTTAHVVAFSYGTARPQGAVMSFVDQTILTGLGSTLGDNGRFPKSDIPGTYVKGKSFTMDASYITYQKSFATFALQSAPSPEMNYEKPADLADLAATWAGSTVGAWKQSTGYTYADPFGKKTTVYIYKSGLLLLNPTDSDCYFTGQVLPRPTGKNVFDVRILDDGGSCSDRLGNTPFEAMSGIAYAYKDTSGAKHFVLSARNPAGTMAIALTGETRLSYGSLTISDVSVENLSYRQNAKFTVTGKDLDQALQLESPACLSLTELGIATSTKRVFECRVYRPGTMTLKLKNTFNKVVFQKNFVVNLQQSPKVEMVTSMGKVVIELDPWNAPSIVNDFLDSVQNLGFNRKFFHGITKDFEVRVGGMNPALNIDSQNKYPSQVLEGWVGFTHVEDANNTLVSNLSNAYKRGDVYRSSVFPDIKGFGIVLQDSTTRATTVFGKIVSGLDVLEAVSRVQTKDISDGWRGVTVYGLPLNPVVIESITVVQ